MQIGDFGRRGDFNQSKVARLLAIKAADMDPDFIISVGDNMYPSAPAISLLALLHVSAMLLQAATAEQACFYEGSCQGA